MEGFAIQIQRTAHAAGMPVRLYHSVISAHDPPGLARFSTQAHGWKVLSERENETRLRAWPERARWHVLHAAAG